MDAEVTTLIQLAIGLLVFALLIAFLLLKVPERYRFKLVLVPVVFALALWMSLTLPSLLGYAYPGEPTHQFQYISHTVGPHGKVNLVTKDSHGKYRMYAFAGTPEILQELAQAQAETQKGQTVIGKFGKSKGHLGFPGLFPIPPSPLTIHSPHNYGMLPPKH